jgi:uncharacterized protein (UPF0333 family)|tara:strand:- start:14 stop:319 length:306 start_codon:yes stop_codon:yes gene_type:complete
MKKIDKKGQAFTQLAQLATGIAVLAIVLVITFLIISQGKSQVRDIEGLNSSDAACQTSLACNATDTIASAVDDIPGWIPLIVVASIGAILLGLVSLFSKRR